MISAFWFKQQPRWLQNLVYDLTGWQVHTMTIWRTRDAGLFSYKVGRTRSYWSRAKKVRA